MKINEFYFKPEFIEILLKHIDAKSLRTIYNLNTQAKYTIDHMVDVIINISSRCYTRYKLPQDLCIFLNLPHYSKYSKTSIKTLVKDQIFDNLKNNSIFNTYVVIGYDIPIQLKELNVIVDCDN
jgi:hypothetical protein